MRNRKTKTETAAKKAAAPKKACATKKTCAADITYGTNTEIGFDYLRDNMAKTHDGLVQRELHFAIVDEVDSILIDEARTPLIISGPVQKGEDQHFAEFKPIVERLYNTQRNEVTKILNEAKRLIAAGNTEEGGKLLLRAHKGLPPQQSPPLLRAALH